jgi:hypothetical protein
MLDLETIFDPDRTVLDPKAPNVCIGPDDLPGDWRVEWEERAAIREFCGKLHREQAEALALAEILLAMERAGVSLIQ